MRESGLLDRRSFTRTRKNLISRGLVVYEAGGPGRGHRSSYELLLDPPEKSAPERLIEKGAEKGAQKGAPERLRSRDVGKKTRRTSEVDLAREADDDGLVVVADADGDDPGSSAVGGRSTPAGDGDGRRDASGDPEAEWEGELARRRAVARRASA
jgi:hypothetical protein